MDEILRVENFCKSFKTGIAVDHLSFSISRGSVFCLLGPNGAGKSTTIAMLASLMPRDGGKVFFDGAEVHGRPARYLSALGIVPQEIALYGNLSARANLEFFASLYELRGKTRAGRVAAALDFAGLSDRADEPIDHFSGGMKRRLNIACALCHKPRLMIMDEPTVGIDPQSRNFILESIRRLREAGTTIIYTSHYMEEVEEIGDRILIMDHGKMVAEGTLEELKSRVGDLRHYRLELDSEVTGLDEAFYRVSGMKRVAAHGGVFELESLPTIENVDAIIKTAAGSGKRIVAFSTVEPGLEQVFLTLTGRSLRD
jgi:ABC-2 type transport system ATP-binding protein